VLCLVRGELLVVRLQEADLAHEQLHIALAHSSDTSSSRRTLAKGSLRPAGLLPGQLYSLALSMSDSCVLYLTLHLGLGAQTQLAALQGSGLVAATAAIAVATAAGPGPGQQQGGSQAMLRLLQAGLPAAAMGQLAAIIPGALRQQLQATPFELWLVWHSPSQQQQQQAPSLYTPVDGREGAAAATAVALRAHNSRSGLLAVVPSSRASSASNAAAARAAGGSSSSGGTGLDGVLAALPWQNLAGVQLWKQQQLDVLVPFLSGGQAALVLEPHLQPYPPPSSSGSKLPAPVSLARLVLPSAALAAPSGRAVGLGNQQLASLHTAGSAVSLAWQGAVVWDVPDYLARLQQLCRQPPQRAGLGARDSHRAAAAAAASLCHAQQQQQQQGSVVDLLVADVLAKQQALERLQRQLDVTCQCAELADSRLAELRSANSTLAADLQHLRQLLHDEKEAAAAARGLLDPSQPGALLPGTAIPVASASREQLLAQLARVLEGGAKERARNAELVRRLQQLHSERVDVLDLQRQHFELQEAHFQQSKLLVDQGINVSTLALLKTAVLDQEALISRLQQVGWS
jgi:hypothetical protein